MSIDIWLGQNVDYGGPDGPEWHDVFECNITHNLGAMWQLAGVYETLYESDGKLAGDLVSSLDGGVEFMRANPVDCRKHDAPNGWGTYKDALPWLERLAAACRRFPKATVRVSR